MKWDLEDINKLREHWPIKTEEDAKSLFGRTLYAVKHKANRVGISSFTSRKALAEQRICSKCKEVKQKGQFYKNSKMSDGLASWCRSCAVNLSTNRVMEKYYTDKKPFQTRQAKYNLDLKMKAFGAYGGAICVCCKETIPQGLTIDHINNDGAEHRRKLKTTCSTTMYRWLRDNNYPPGFQVMCYTCNIMKYRNGGVCLHQAARVSISLSS